MTDTEAVTMRDLTTLRDYVEKLKPMMNTHPFEWAITRIECLEAENDRLNALINTPQVDDFLEAVRIEVAHQRERWGEDHDADKTGDWWLWTLAYLATKATQAERYGDKEKYMHHIITSAALCANWHRHVASVLPKGD